jgi:predicted lipoprotein with Yx(FWY)xxD motif
MLGKIKRGDGSTQITYNGWPLYYDKDDTHPSEIHGEGANAFGGRWSVISPPGAPIGK